MATQATSDFTILGPATASGERALNAVHALYFLPENFKLVLTGSATADQSFLRQVAELVDHYGVGHRVTFDGEATEMHLVILPNNSRVAISKDIAGDSPEALASAILSIARTAD